MDLERIERAAPGLSWPDEPYKGLAYYGPEDALLFAGRDDDVDDCVHFLAEPRTRMLLLHGRTGCGKSSFLRAGLIPTLEERGFGFQFLRKARKEREHGDVVFIRCGGDPIARVAEELFHYVSQPQSVPTAKGTRELNLSSAGLGHTEITKFIDDCTYPGVLLRAFETLSKLLLHTLVIILDQAEEVITLTQPFDERRRLFFQFLQEFNATNVAIKFVIALRKDHFGEFFNLLQVDASVKTDVKQFPLSDLTYDEVLGAIELPTDRSPRRRHGPPYDKYGFEYQDGLAKLIATDLFSVVPSGGVLPVMQIVCRDLYNDVRLRQKPWIIDEALYLSGNRVTGRVGRHISRSLQSSFREALVPPGSLAAEEEKWRRVLFNLVRREADGTVQTDVLSAMHLLRLLKEAGALADPERVLAHLTLADTLVLRGLTIIGLDGKRDQLAYSLGHDAIGLALYEWRLQQDEVARRVVAEGAVRRRTIAVMAAVVFALVVCAGSWLFIADGAWRAKRVEVGYLVSTADRVKRKDPNLALFAAVEAAKLAQAIESRSPGRFWRAPDPGPLHTLATLLASLPQTVSPSIVGSLPAQAEVFLLPKSARFLFWDGHQQVETASVSGKDRTRYNVKGILSEGPKDDSQVRGVSEPFPGVILLQIGESGLPGQGDGIVIMNQNQVVGKYDRAYFLLRSHGKIGGSEVPRPLRKPAPRPSFNTMNLLLNEDIVYLYRMQAEGFGANLFSLKPASPKIEPFANAGTFVLSMRQLNQHRSIFGSVWLSDESPQVDERHAPSGARKPALAALVATDYRGGAGAGANRLWKSEALRDDALAECQDALRRNGECNIMRFTPYMYDSKLAGFVVLSVSYGEAGKSQREKWVVIKLASGATMDIDITHLDEQRGTTWEGPRSDAGQPSPEFSRRGPVIVGGSLDSLVLGIVQDRAIDVFLIARHVSSFLGTLLNPKGVVKQVVVTADKQEMLATGDGVGIVWDISRSIDNKVAVMERQGSAALIRVACENVLDAKLVTNNSWRDATGFKQDRPQDPCRDTNAKRKR
jgi:hypothetical protein